LEYIAAYQEPGKSSYAIFQSLDAPKLLTFAYPMQYELRDPFGAKCGVQATKRGRGDPLPYPPSGYFWFPANDNSTEPSCAALARLVVIPGAEIIGVLDPETTPTVMAVPGLDPGISPAIHGSAAETKDRRGGPAQSRP
jgi:hypothetical protein